METCVKCGMPMDADSHCSCDSSLCFHCCACQPDCSCGCSNMIDDYSDDEEEEEYSSEEDVEENDLDDDEEDEF